MSDSHYIDAQNIKTTPIRRGDWWITGKYLHIAMCGGYANHVTPPHMTMFITTNKNDLNVANMYPVVRAAGSSNALSFLYKEDNNHSFPVYYPKGTILWYNDQFIVTTSVCDVRSPSGIRYSKLYPWCPTTLYTTGDYVVWDGAIYKALSNVSSTTESPSADNLNWKLVQYAPLCKIGTVLPGFLLTVVFETCYPSNTWFSDGLGGYRNSRSPRPVYKGSDSANRVNNFMLRLGICTSSTSNYLTHPDMKYSSGNTKDYIPDKFPLSQVPETMLNAVSDFGMNYGTLSMPFTNGTTLIVPVRTSIYKHISYDLTQDTTITHNRGKVPLLIPNLIDRPITDPTLPASSNANEEYTMQAIDSMFFYDPFSDCIRYCPRRNEIFRYFPTYTHHFTSTGLFFWYGEFPYLGVGKWCTGCVGQIIQALSNLVVFNCATISEGLGYSLLQDLFLYRAIDECKIKLYYVKEDNILSQNDIYAFLTNKKYCTYVGMVDLCNDNIYSIGNLPGVVFPVSPETIVYDSDNDIVYITKKYIGQFNGDFNSHVAKGNIKKLPQTKHNEVVASSKDEAKKIAEATDKEKEDVVYKDENTGETKDANDNVVSKSDNDTEVTVKPYPEVEKEETVVLPSLDDCVVDDSANGIYTVKASLKRTELTAYNTVKKGIAYGSLFLWDLSAVKSVKKGCYFYSGGLIYKATADLTSVTSSNCVEVGRILYGTIYALYSDYATDVKWLKGQYLIYRGHTSYQGYTSYVILQAQDNLSFNSKDETEYLDTKKFKKVGVFYYTWEDCTHKKLNYALEYDTFPSCFELPASSNVVRDNKVINIVKPVNGGLDLTGQVLAGYIVNKAPV